MSEPNHGQHSGAGAPNRAQSNQGSARGNGAPRLADGTGRRPAEAHPVEAVDLFADLAAACVPTFCDGLQFDLDADGADGLSASYPPGEPPSTDAAGSDAAAGDASAEPAEHHTAPGRIVVSVQAELADGEPPVVATITCTWHDADRPTEADAVVARLLADQAAAKLRLESVGAALQKQITRAGNLEEALATNREIGQAIGILMATHHVTAEQAFEQLRTASQHTHRKLREIAADVTETGVLTVPAEAARSQPNGGPSVDGRTERHPSHRVQRRTRGGQPVAASPDEA